MRLASILLLLVPLSLGACEDKYQKQAAQAAASASAAAAASAAALASVVAHDEKTAPPVHHKPAGESITCQHVLIAYKGAKNAPFNVTRTKEEARKRAEAALAMAKDPKYEFEDVVDMYTDDVSTKDRRGSLGRITKKSVVAPFADAAWALDVGQVSGIVETPFGFHIIKRNQ